MNAVSDCGSKFFSLNQSAIYGALGVCAWSPIQRVNAASTLYSERPKSDCRAQGVWGGMFGRFIESARQKAGLSVEQAAVLAEMTAARPASAGRPARL